MRFFLAVLCFALLVTGARAHEVTAQVSGAGAVVVKLQYADGQAFAFEAYEVLAAGNDHPIHVGRTDAEGRAVFLAPGPGELRLRAFSADGHGLDLRFVPEATAANASVRASEDRAARIMLGIGVVLALFGAAQLFLRRRG